MNALAGKLQGRTPKTAIILGSSLGALAEAVQEPLVIPYTDLPGFPVPRISGHAGKLFAGMLGSREVAVLAGRAHPYESGNAAVMRPAIEMLKGVGIETLILTNAAGSLNPEMRPGSIMLIADHINCSGMNPLTGQHGDENFVPMTDAYDPALRKRFHAAAKAEGIALHEGVYCWYSGPSFETPAEIRMFQLIGGSAVGMSTAPETILARRFGLKVAGLSVITNLAAGIEGASPSHGETKREGAKAAENVKALVTRFLRDA
ncbi:MAG: purine-nucleoside phosphorylase [Aestuariivirga sp.]|uniref:purine-nucleoside phosphorylase n=1 Tax=Aestuariivirga sp. TaxID=2650926 RepID=UPI0025C08CB3|nr:purine-nucleoside phosphorylase [Aestuariivirga sp.]MCA3559578.1 purine-nucleoside phosphorylase [Aestuariivirga sp.]